MSDLPMDWGDSPPTPTGARGRRCSHPSPHREPDGGGGWRCGSCSHRVDAGLVRRGRAARRTGQRKERVVMARTGLRNVGGANGPEDGLSERFVAQSKAFAPGRFPGWMLVELDYLRTGLAGTELGQLVRASSAGRLPVLFVAENPGQGRRARETLAIMGLSDWQAAVGQEGSE